MSTIRPRTLLPRCSSDTDAMAVKGSPPTVSGGLPMKFSMLPSSTTLGTQDATNWRNVLHKQKSLKTPSSSKFSTCTIVHAETCLMFTIIQYNFV